MIANRRFSAVCKSAAYRFDGSNPSSPTRKRPIQKDWSFSVYGYLEDGFDRPALSKCPVDTCNRRGFSAEKRILLSIYENNLTQIKNGTVYMGKLFPIGKVDKL